MRPSTCKSLLILLPIKLCGVTALLSSKYSSTCRYSVKPTITRNTVNQMIAISSSSSSAVSTPSSQFPLEFFKTPGSSNTPHNFGPASPLDAILYTAERPGNPKEKTGRVSADKVREWIDYVRGTHGVTTVISLLDDDELEIYEQPSLASLLEQDGMKCFIIPMGGPGACHNIMSIIEQAERDGEKVVCHCTGGVGRAGRVAAAWLVHRYNLSPEVATLIVLDQAFQSGVKRLGHSKKLSGWLGYSS